MVTQQSDSLPVFPVLDQATAFAQCGNKVQSFLFGVLGAICPTTFLGILDTGAKLGVPSFVGGVYSSLVPTLKGRCLVVPCRAGGG